MNKELLKEYLSNRIKAGNHFSITLFSPFLAKMILRMVMKQNFWTVSLNAEN